MEKEIEIELHEATVIAGVVHAEYTVYDGDSTSDIRQQITKATLVRFIKEKELNAYCADLITGRYDYFNPFDYLAENLDYVVLEFLKEELS